MILFYLKNKSSGKVFFFLFDQKPNQILSEFITTGVETNKTGFCLGGASLIKCKHNQLE